ncbi:Uncharacterised protein [Mycobacteroides abscessus subsp. abscessus]|nr:Uncharacterised protein [Mycobacteroides abscessus subsp. abscessus]
MGDQGACRRRVGRSVHHRGDRQFREREIHGAVIVQNQQPVLTTDHDVIDGVFDTGAAQPDWRKGRHGILGVPDQDLRCHRRMHTDGDKAITAGAADPNPESLVRFGEHLDRFRAATQCVPANSVGPEGLIDHGIVERAAVHRPGCTGTDIGDLVRIHLAGAQVLEPQRVHLMADDVDRIGQCVPVRADGGGTEREEVVACRLHVTVEQDLLTRNVVIQGRRCPVVRIAYRTTTMNSILLSLKATGVVPPLPHPGRDRKVGLLGARLDLTEDGGAQLRQMAKLVIDIGVFRL